jgi:hypothetical protein
MNIQKQHSNKLAEWLRQSSEKEKVSFFLSLNLIQEEMMGKVKEEVLL